VSGDAPAWFETLAVRQIHEGYSRVRIETVRTPSGEEVVREVVDHDDAVGVVALTRAGEIVLLRQYRQPLRSYLLEIPAGTLDVDGERAEDAARRELAEESGHRADGLERLATFYNSAGWSNEATHLFLANPVVPCAPPDGFTPDAEEADMEVVLLPFDQAIAEARAGSLTDAKTALGILLAAARLGA
jgi:8-oxo-dGTP pyrophosphatase MutT (NUDIX family)